VEVPAEFNAVALVLAVLLGGAVGLERQWHGRPAGLRTHTLVCLTATMLIVVSRAVARDQLDLGEAGRVVFDPNRMGAGIVTGIGFLGAATVIRSADHLRGLTTAACIWFVAGLGIVLGTGHFTLGVAVTAIVLIVLVGVSRLEGRIRPTVYRRLTVVATGRESGPIVAAVRGQLDAAHIRVLDVASSWSSDTESTELSFYVALRDRDAVPPLIERLAGVEGVTLARWRLIR
jgi:putative Mg2+ transporter-C (MgtC) family protein